MITTTHTINPIRMETPHHKQGTIFLQEITQLSLLGKIITIFINILIIRVMKKILPKKRPFPRQICLYQPSPSTRLTKGELIQSRPITCPKYAILCMILLVMVAQIRVNNHLFKTPANPQRQQIPH